MIFKKENNIKLKMEAKRVREKVKENKIKKI